MQWDMDDEEAVLQLGSVCPDCPVSPPRWDGHEQSVSWRSSILDDVSSSCVDV